MYYKEGVKERCICFISCLFVRRLVVLVGESPGNLFKNLYQSYITFELRQWNRAGSLYYSHNLAFRYFYQACHYLIYVVLPFFWNYALKNLLLRPFLASNLAQKLSTIYCQVKEQLFQTNNRVWGDWGLWLNKAYKTVIEQVELFVTISIIWTLV